MATLHMIFSASSDTVQTLAELIQPGDAALLGADGCYLYAELKGFLPCYLLSQDASDRGINTDESADVLSDEEWFELVCRFEQQVTWP